MTKKRIDPGKDLFLFLKFTIVTLIWIPFLIYNIKEGNILRVILFVFIYIVLMFLIKKFQSKPKEQSLQNVSFVGYMFSGLGFFLALCFIFAFILDYFRSGISPDINLILITCALVIFSIVMLYFANKYRK